MADPLLALPPGSFLAVAGVACALLRGKLVAAFGLTAVVLEASRLSVSAQTLVDSTGVIQGAFGCDGVALMGATAVLFVVGLAGLSAVRKHTAAESAASPGLALVLAGLALAAVQAGNLFTIAGLLFLAGAVELVLTPGSDDLGRDPATTLPTASSRVWRSGALVSLASSCLIGLGAQGRVQSGGGAVMEWIGTPFAGDAPTTLLFLGLALPVALPPTLGGATYGLAGGAVRHDEGSFIYPGLLRGIVLVVALGRAFSGTDALLTIAVVATVLAPVLVLLGRRTAARQLAFAVYAAFGLLLGFAAIASEAAGDAFALGLLGLSVSASGAALALVHLTHARGVEPGLGSDGLGRVFPAVFAFGTIAVLGLAALPGTLAFEGRALGLGALSADGAGPEALILAVAMGPLAALACAPFLTGLFLSPSGAPDVRQGSRPRAPWALTVSLGLAAGISVALGVAPGAVAPLLPFESVAGDRFPTSLQQAQLLLGALLVALLCAPRVDSSTAPTDASLSSRP